MSSAMRRFKILGLFLLTLCGVGTLVANSAQANWLEEGFEITANKHVFVKAHTAGELSIPSLNIEFRCLEFESSTLKLVGKSSKAEGEVYFRSCTAYSPTGLKGTAQPKCKPEEPITVGSLALIKLLAKSLLGTLNNYILFEPPIGRPFTTIRLPETCALAETSDVKGSLVAECGTLVKAGEFASEDCGISRIVHLLRPGPTTMWESNGVGGHKEVKDGLTFGENIATPSGVAAAELIVFPSWAAHV